MPGLQEKSEVDAGTGAVLHGMMSMLAEVLDGLDRRLDGMEARLEAIAAKADEAAAAAAVPPPPPPPAPELDTTELYAAIDTVVARVAEQVTQQVGALASELTEADERVARIEDAVVTRVAEQLAERMTQLEVGLVERVTHAESALAERLSALDDAFADRAVDVIRAVETLDVAGPIDSVQTRVDQVVGQLTERIGQAEQVATAQIEGAEQRVVMQLVELDAAVAALRAESAALPANLSEQLQGAINSWRGRLRRGESDEVVKRGFEELGAAINDGMARLHEAVNRAQGESLGAAQSTIDEVRSLLDAAGAASQQSAAEQLDAVAAVAERLVAVHDELTRSSTALAETVAARIEAAQQAVVDAIPEPTTADDAAAQQAQRQQLEQLHTTIQQLKVWLDEELTRMRDAVHETHTRAGAVAATVARQVDDVVQAAVVAVGDRVAKERTTADGIRRDVELLGTRLEELGKSVSAGRREFAVTAQGLPDLLRSVIAENDLGPAIDAMQAALSSQLSTQSTTVLDAVTAANSEHQDVLRALHSSLAKRFDARARTIAETLDGLAASLEVARTVGPSLERVGTRLEAQQPFLDQLRHELVQVSAAVGSLPADMERRHAEAVAAVEQVNDTLAGLRKHAAALDRAVLGMRASHEGLAAAFVDLRDGNGVVPQRLDQIAGSIELTRRQLGEVGEVARTVAGAVEQQQAMGNRLAELVTQVRAATRSDIERVESSIHLEVLKQHQQDQARLTQAVAGVSEVVEREAAVISQRVAALASEVDGIRMELATGDPGR